MLNSEIKRRANNGSIFSKHTYINMNTYENEIIDENMENHIWDGLSYCHSCNNGCSPGMNMIILKKEFTGLCNGMSFSGRLLISFVNPDNAAFSCIKRLLELEKQARIK